MPTKQNKSILYISYNGAAEPVTNSQVIPYLKGLASRGYPIDLLTFEKNDGVFQNKENISKLTDELRRFNITWHRLRYHKRPSLLATSFDIFTGSIYSAYLALTRRYSIIHARQIVPAAMCVPLKAVLKIRWVFDMRGLVAEEYVGHGAWREGGIKFKLVKYFEKASILSADHIVVLTERHKDVLISLPFVQGRGVSVSVIPCCADTSRFEPAKAGEKRELRARFGFGEGFILLYLGSLGTCYLLDEMMAFFKSLKEREPQATFLFLTNYGADGIVSSAKKIGLPASSVKVKFAEPFEVHNWIKLADAGIYFINPYKKFGSCPIKTGEYLASGLPMVINSGIGDSESFVNDHRMGVVIKDFNNGEYERAIDGMLSLTKDSAIAERCKKAAADHLSVESGVKGYADIYENIISRFGKRSKKILFLVPYPKEGASNRVRVEQFMPYLNRKGFITKVRPFVSRRFYSILYLPGHQPEKVLWFFISTCNRFLDIFRAIRYDVIFVHREAYPFGGPIIESILCRMCKILVFDFDDAIFLPNTSEYNIYIERFKRPEKTAKIIKMSSQIIVGNNYLKEYALQHNGNIHVIPSSVDTERYKPLQAEKDGNQITIGWIGSRTTRNFLYELEDVFIGLSEKYDNLVFKIVGAQFHSAKIKNIVCKEWSLGDEVGDIQSFDIGIMPMPNNKWTKGKCAFKTILYMACGIASVSSAVGMNLEVVDNGIDGYLVKDEDEWLEKLSLLVEDRNLRQGMARKGREKVLKRYSLQVIAPLLYKVLQETAQDEK